MNWPVWTYWESPPHSEHRPSYIDLCLRTILHHSNGLPVHVLDRTTVHHFLPDLRPEVDELPTISARADYIRAALLLRHGGLWLDADVIVLSDLRRVVNLLGIHEALTSGASEGDLTIGFFGARPGAELVQRWSAAQDAFLDSWRGRRPSWGCLGFQVLQPLLKSSYFLDVPMSRVAPIRYTEWRRFLSRTAPMDRYLRDEPFVALLYNQVMKRSLEQMGPRGLTCSRRLISRLLRVGLGLSTPEQEESLLHHLAPLGDVLMSLERMSRRGLESYRAWTR